MFTPFHTIQSFIFRNALSFHLYALCLQKTDRFLQVTVEEVLSANAQPPPTTAWGVLRNNGAE